MLARLALSLVLVVASTLAEIVPVEPPSTVEVDGVVVDDVVPEAEASAGLVLGAEFDDVAASTEPESSLEEIDVVVPPVRTEVDSDGSPVPPEVQGADDDESLRGERGPENGEIASEDQADDYVVGEVPETDDDTIVANQLVEGTRLESDVVETGYFQTLGMTWSDAVEVGDLGAQVRTRTDGEWSDWIDLEQGEGAPDPGTPDDDAAVRGGTDPVWVGEADAVQLSFRATSDGGPEDMRLALISSEDPEQLAASAYSGDDAEFHTAVFSPGVLTQATAPRIIRRSEWGAPARACTPAVASTLNGVVLHHTAGSNSYSNVAQASQQIRNDALYHMNGRGWCDLGYNFVVDKWGNVYEGRAGSIDAPVVGVHAGGFNTGTVGISMLGSYGTVSPSAAVRESIARIAAWKLQPYYRDPGGSFTMTTQGGENSKFSAGTRLTLPVIFAHRDVAYTACPGNAGYAALGEIRTRARQLAGPSLVNPSLSATTVASGTPVQLRAQSIGNLDWRLEVVDVRTRVSVRVSVGYGQAALGGVVATWDGRNGFGQPVGPGQYTVSLTATERGTGRSVRPFSGSVTVTGSQNPPRVSPVPLRGDLQFVPITPTRLLDTRPRAQSLGPASRHDLVVAGVGGVPANARAVALNVTAVAGSTVSHIRAWPAGTAMPTASMLNARSGSTSAAGVMVGVGGEGKVSFYNDAGSVHLIVDVTGYYTDAGSGARYTSLPTATRVLDSRVQGGRFSSRETRTVTVAGRDGVPSGATAALINVTSVVARDNGFVSVVPSGTRPAGTSSVNHLRGHDVSNRVIVPLHQGKVDVYVEGGEADVVLDVVGWFGADGALRFTPVQPRRVFDTRTGTALRQAETRSVPVRTSAGLPATAQQAVLSITATKQTASATYVTVWPAHRGRPGTSDLNTGSGRDQANMAVVGWDSQGNVAVYNDRGTTHLVADVFGYFAP